jgi:hypothetical protein
MEFWARKILIYMAHCVISLHGQNFFVNFEFYSVNNYVSPHQEEVLKLSERKW